MKSMACHSRSYSLTNIQSADGQIEFAVKRVPGGLLSNWCTQQVRVGDYLEVGRHLAMPACRAAIRCC